MDDGKYIKSRISQRGYWPKNYQDDLPHWRKMGLLEKKSAEKMWGKENIIHIRIEYQELRTP